MIDFKEYGKNGKYICTLTAFVKNKAVGAILVNFQNRKNLAKFLRKIRLARSVVRMDSHYKVYPKLSLRWFFNYNVRVSVIYSESRKIHHYHF